MSASCEVFAFQTTQRCHSVFSCRSPEGPFHVRLVASENVATRLPPDVERTSGSAPTLPIRVTLFRLRLTISSWRVSLRRGASYTAPTDACKRTHAPGGGPLPASRGGPDAAAHEPAAPGSRRPSSLRRR